MEIHKWCYVAKTIITQTRTIFFNHLDRPYGIPFHVLLRKGFQFVSKFISPQVVWEFSAMAWSSYKLNMLLKTVFPSQSKGTGGVTQSNKRSNLRKYVNSHQKSRNVYKQPETFLNNKDTKRATNQAPFLLKILQNSPSALKFEILAKSWKPSYCTKPVII